MLFAWAFGALLEGLVGFGYPWAVVAPILIAVGIPDLDAIRVAAIANNAPVSYGALGVPIVGLAAVTGLPLMQLSASVGHIVAILALLPPWVLIYLVCGRAGFRDGWPLAIVGSLGYIAGQFPSRSISAPICRTSPARSSASSACFVLLKFWRPKQVLGYGGVPVSAAAEAAARGRASCCRQREMFRAWLPFIVLIVVVVLWTGPWSQLPRDQLVQPVGRGAFVAHAGRDRARGVQLRAVHRRHRDLRLLDHRRRCCSGRAGAASGGVRAHLPSDVGRAAGRRVHLRARLRVQLLGHGGLAGQRLLEDRAVVHRGRADPRLDRRRAVGQQHLDQRDVRRVPGGGGQLLGFPPLLLPSLNSVGAEIGKPIAPQTASVGVSTSRFVRDEGEIIRHNMGWTFILLAYLIVIGLIFYFLAPGVMTVHNMG